MSPMFPFFFYIISFTILLLLTIILPRLTTDYKYRPFLIFSAVYAINYTFFHLIFGISSYYCLLLILSLIFITQVLARKLRVIGLTGQICSGKTTVANYLQRKYNCRILNMDSINREVLSRKDVLKEIRNSFGEEVFNEKGELDKIALRNLIFSDHTKKRRLEDITHKRVFIKYIYEVINHKFFGNKKILILENAILLKLPIFKLFFYPIIGVCNTNKDIIIQRIIERDNVSKETAINILKNQLSSEDFQNQCDYCIFNDKDEKYLEEQVDKFISIVGKKI